MPRENKENKSAEELAAPSVPAAPTVPVPGMANLDATPEIPPAVTPAAARSVPHIAAVTVKLPPFYRNNCEYWINQCQAQFAVRNITAQLTKFYYCVSVIDEGTALHIEDIVSNPGETPYDDLCDRLREAFSLNNYQRAEALARYPPLADEKPSQLLAKLRALLPKNGDAHEECFIFRYFFLARLPVDIRQHCLTNSELSLRELAIRADELFMNAASNQINALTSEDAHEDVTSHPGCISGCISEINAVERNSKRQLCFYHDKYRDKAVRCRKPCAWMPRSPTTSYTASKNGRTGRR